MSFFRAIYTLLTWFALPLIVLRLWWRGRKEPRYRLHVAERFGRFTQAPLSGSIWIHAVSVGEMRAAQPLVEGLAARHPQRPVLLTCMTPTGRATAESLYAAGGTTVVYLPYDVPTLLRRLIVRFRPAVLVVMETELWPNLFAACQRAGITTMLVNARLSSRSHRRYARLAPIRALARETLARIDHVAAQNRDDAVRLQALGATDPVVTGNLKFDVPISPSMRQLGESWRATLSPTRRVLLAVSTRDGEERAIASAYAQAFDAEKRTGILLVIVPRHPQRFDEVAVLLRESGLRLARRSDTAPPEASTEVWLGDSMGEVAAYVAMCDLAFVGGSLLPLGGQNLIEVCAQGKPVLMGPSTFNFADAARAASHAGALISVQDAAGLMKAAGQLMADPATLAERSAAAKRFAEQHGGAAEKTLASIGDALAHTKN
jgi:3-deoxy-D-manno-octulosonic-acid transferase